MRFLIVLCMLVSSACLSEKEKQAIETEERVQAAAAFHKMAKERTEKAKELAKLVAWKEANVRVVEDDKWTVIEVRASHILVPITSIESGGNPGLGSVAGGGAAALAGFGPVGIVTAGAVGAILADEPTKQVTVTGDEATCVIIGEKSPKIQETFLFNKKNSEWLGLCLNSRPGDTIVFRKTTRREWRYVDSKEEREGSPFISHELVLLGKPK